MSLRERGQNENVRRGIDRRQLGLLDHPQKFHGRTLCPGVGVQIGAQWTASHQS